MSYVFGELPDKQRYTRPRSDLARLAAACRENPGKWTVLRRGPSTERHKISPYGIGVAKRYGLVSACRTDGDECVVYVSYQGDAS